MTGMVGLAYNKAATGRPITKIDDLWDPAFKGKVSLLSDTQDGLGMIMLSQGNSPENPTTETVQKAVDLVKEQKDKGQIRRFTGNDYADDLAAGNIVIAQAYSGDVVQLQADNPDLEFVVPEAGGDWFIDTQVIPYTTAEPEGRRGVDRLRLRPRRTTPSWSRSPSTCPVLSDMTDELNKIDPKLAANPLINPPQEMQGQAQDLACAHRRADPGVQHRVRRSHRQLARRMAGVASSSRQRSKIAPYLMILPALAYLAVFFVVPFWSLFRTSLSTMGGSIYLPKLTFAWDFSNYAQALHAVPGSDHPVTALRADRDRGVAADLLPAGLRHRVQVGSLQEPAAGSGDPAVLRDVPGPHPGVEDDLRRRRHRGAHTRRHRICVGRPPAVDTSGR